ncbi:MAG: hypothetical protein Q8R28_15245 [Dehalococcoidia bacterium]|nr:hypothetical protein [Dehalococcoidia bacterium]
MIRVTLTAQDFLDLVSGQEVVSLVKSDISQVTGVKEGIAIVLEDMGFSEMQRAIQAAIDAAEDSGVPPA